MPQLNFFISRANHSLPGFQIKAEDTGHIIRICKLVGGLPLGIELAAASIRNFSPEQIADDLQQNLGILSTTMKDIPERHRSIRAAFSHSWSFLTEAEKDVYRRLSIFQGEFSMDAASSTTGATIQIISSLADKSLIQINSSGFYAIQPLLRQFAAEKLSDHVNSGIPNPVEDEVDLSIHTFDPITNLPNKVLFRYSFKNAITRARRTQHNVVLLLVEVTVREGGPGTKKIPIDNKTIKSFAKYLKEIVRESDIVSHLLTGKFAILLEGFSYPSAGRLLRIKSLRILIQLDILVRKSLWILAIASIQRMAILQCYGGSPAKHYS